MLHPQPFDDRAIQVRIGESQFIRQYLGLRVEVGEMVTPPFDFAPCRGDGFGFYGRRASGFTHTAAAMRSA